MRVGNQNVFQSLKNLDPTLYIADNFSMGSDPNTTPTMSMRGTSSFPTTETSSLKATIKINLINPYSFLMVLKQLPKL